jgi:hypothetical protein
MKKQLTFLLVTVALLLLNACAEPAPSGNAPNVKPPTAKSGADNQPLTGAPGAKDLELMTAANKGDNAKVTELLTQGANVNAQKPPAAPR